MNREAYRELTSLLDARFSKVDAAFRDLRAEIDRRLGELRAQLRAELRAELRADIQAAATETRHHFDIVHEKFRQDVALLAEGHEAHSAVLADHEGRLVRLEQGRLRFDA